MSKYLNLLKNLRENILVVIAGSHRHDQLNRLIAVSHTLANSFLASKTTAGTLASTYGMSTSDLAYDCIADLFQKDADGNYIQLLSYFKGLPITTAKQEEVLAHLRRLVFSKVNQGIYRLYSEADPSLAKIIRNIKIAVNVLKNYDEVEKFGESSLVPSACNPLEHLPPIDKDLLEQRISAITTGRELVPELMAKLSLYLREQNEHCRVIPIVTVAILFRSIYNCRQDLPNQVVMEDVELIASDTSATIKNVCEDIKNKNQIKYVGEGKISEEMFEKYFIVLEEELREKFIGKNGHDFSLYESLKKLSPDLTKEDYKKNHRNKIEYLLKQVNKEAVKRLKDV
ncbi:MAG: hypothetical protein HY964_01490 [Ignavibacteriales bacterium]|nr:hypothetical protein [Ignavibacteriales bacterium]